MIVTPEKLRKLACAGLLAGALAAATLVVDTHRAAAQDQTFELFGTPYMIVTQGTDHMVQRRGDTLLTIRGADRVTVRQVTRDATYEAAVLEIANPASDCPVAALVVWTHPEQGDGYSEPIGNCNAFNVRKLARVTQITFRGSAGRPAEGWIFDMIGGLRIPGRAND